MTEEKQQLEALRDIRSLMQQSSKFLSLSGLSGIFAGVYALVGAYLGHIVISNFLENVKHGTNFTFEYRRMILLSVLICSGVLILSLLTAFYFSNTKSKKLGQKLFDHTTLRLFLNMFIPLLAGGIFCISLLYHGGVYMLLVAPSMLIFYGLALVNGSKYTLHDIRYLGLLEIAIGIASCFYLSAGLWFWAIGFGALHIIYGAYMWFKHDRHL